MSSADVIDALFDRTVDIVQSLPKSGPIQTSYEEKLALYSLYKQATEGDVTSKRPGMLDMLGRAKWDAWAQRQGMNPLDAKQLYVESMMRTLRKFADRPQARELIEELEAFSGDVAERVMRGALETDDTASEASSAPAPLRHRPQRPVSDDEEDEGDRLSSLRKTTASRQQGGSRRNAPTAQQQQRYSQASSVEGASTLAAHGGRTGQSVGSSTPQRPAGSDESSEEDDDNVGYEGARPGPTSMRGPGISTQHQHQYQHGGQGGQGHYSYGRPSGPSTARYGPPGPPSSVGGGLGRGPSSGPNVYGQQRGPPSSVQGHYPQSSVGRFPPPRSESNAGITGGGTTGGAGASLYSAGGPSRPPGGGTGGPGGGGGGTTAVEHHYYHRPSDAAGGTGGGPGRAASSVGGRSNPGGTRAPLQQQPGNSNGREVDQALQSIQASLAALHERLNRVEGSGGVGGAGAGGLRSPGYGPSRGGGGSGQRGGTGSTGALAGAYRAVLDAAHDIAVLLGISSSSSRAVGAAPSFGQSTSAGNGQGGSRTPSLLRAPLTLLLAVINLALRLTLDLTSLGILLTVLLFLFKRITGRGDPLVLLRMARRGLGRRAGPIEKAAILGASAAAAAVAGVAGTVSPDGGGNAAAAASRLGRDGVATGGGNVR